jgi:hypothetical protein
MVGTCRSISVSYGLDQKSNQLFSRFKVVSKDDDGPPALIEYFNSYFQENFGASPGFFIGTLKQAVAAVFYTEAMHDVCLSQ